jgi:chromosome segregation ATPase
MLKETLIILLLIALIYYYRQSQKPLILGSNSGSGELQTQLEQTQGANLVLTSFLKNSLNSNSLEELKGKLGGKTLDELIEENEDYETEVDTLTRTKNSLEADLLTQSNAFQSRLREKDREVERLKKDLKDEKGRADKTQENLTSEKQQHKGSLERISLLTGQIKKLEQEKGELAEQVKKMPGEFPEEKALEQKHQDQLREIYALFDLRARGMKEINFNQLMGVLKETKKKVDKK